MHTKLIALCAERDRMKAAHRITEEANTNGKTVEERIEQDIAAHVAFQAYLNAQQVYMTAVGEEAAARADQRAKEGT